MRAMRSTQSGFTLLELLTGITVVAILVGVAAPSFRSFLNNTRVTTAQNDLVAALNLARGEAVRRATTMTACPSASGTACDAGNTWASGWIVFRDQAAAGAVADTADIVQKWGAITGGITLATSSLNVQFQPTGFAANAVTMDVSYTGCIGTRLRHVQVSLGGSISSHRQQCP
jgi:type IV fimbrial biogenesis protein FimT